VAANVVAIRRMLSERERDEHTRIKHLIARRRASSSVHRGGRLQPALAPRL